MFPRFVAAAAIVALRRVERGSRAMLVVDSDEYPTPSKEGADWKVGR